MDAWTPCVAGSRRELEVVPPRNVPESDEPLLVSASPASLHLPQGAVAVTSSITRSEGARARGRERGSKWLLRGNKVAHAACRGPSIVKEIVYGIALGISAGLVWKMPHWNNQRRTKEFYDLLERGVVGVVVEDE